MDLRTSNELISEKLSALAVSKNGLSLEFIPKKLKTEQLCLLAVSQNGLALKYVPQKMKNIEIIKTIEQNPISLNYATLKDRRAVFECH